MEDWWEKILSDDNFFHYKPRLCHGDAWYENILVDDDYLHVVGVIDFSNMMIGDPAVDLAPQLYLGKEFYDAVLNEYIKVFDNDVTINQRIKRHQELRKISGLQFVIKNNQIDEYDDSICRKIKLYVHQKIKPPILYHPVKGNVFWNGDGMVS